jgi:hypothetical protein
LANLTIAQLTALATSTGFADPVTAAAIAMAESGGNPDAVGDTSITPPFGSVGLWQINVAAHPSYTAESLHDPTTNAQAALAISNGGTTFTPWSTYTTTNPALSYSRFLPAAQAAAGSSGESLLANPIVHAAFILAAGAGAVWLIETGALEDAMASLRGLARRTRQLLSV